MSKRGKSSDLVFAKGKWLMDENEVQRLLADSDPEDIDDDINDPDFTIQEAIVEQTDYDHEHEDDDDDEEEEVDRIIPPNNTITESSVVQSKSGSWIVSDFERRILPVVEVRSSNIDLKLPIEYFRRYFDDKHFEDAAMYTNMYYFNKKGILLKTSPNEIMKLYGMFLIMGCIPFPRITLYWKAGYNLDKISSAMTKNRFKVLRTSLHYADVSRIPEEAKSNMFWQVSPIIEAVRNRCHNIERFVDRYSIDEQMIPFTGRCPGRQFVRNKPRPVGLKNFVVTTTSGLVLDFEIYQGIKTKLPDMSLGLGPAVVLRLIKTLPEGSFLYFDRYFTTIPLLKKLEALNYKATGTIQQNRLKGLRFKDDKRMTRGSRTSSFMTALLQLSSGRTQSRYLLLRQYVAFNLKR